MYTTSVSLLARLQDSQAQDEWPRFVDLYTPLLFHLARRRGLQVPDASDLVQDVLTTVVCRLPEFEYDPRRSFRSWLMTITMNRLRDWSRRQSVRDRGRVDVTDNLDQLPGPDGTDDVSEQEYQQYLVRRALQIMQSSFQTTTWQACWEHTVAGRPAAEVGDELGISEGAVYVATSRVLRRLREELDGLMN